MTAVQQVLFEMETAYAGHAYYVTGNALYHAIAGRVGPETRKTLQVSHGVFVPGDFGSYPDEHSQTGAAPYLGSGLRPVKAYDDLFLFRDATHRWLSDSRPREVHNTHDIQTHGGRRAYAPRTRFGLSESDNHTQRSVTWHVHVYLHGEEDVLPVESSALDGIQVGGNRNYGFGTHSFKESQIIDLDDLDYSRIREADRIQIELLSPYVLETDYPGADNQAIPWWWGYDGELRRRTELLADGSSQHGILAVDHGQVVEYTGDDPVQTAKNGVLRVGSHGRYGYGEFRLRPVSEDDVTDRIGVSDGGEV